MCLLFSSCALKFFSYAFSFLLLAQKKITCMDVWRRHVNDTCCFFLKIDFHRRNEAAEIVILSSHFWIIKKWNENVACTPFSNTRMLSDFLGRNSMKVSTFEYCQSYSGIFRYGKNEGQIIHEPLVAFLAHLYINLLKEAKVRMKMESLWRRKDSVYLLAEEIFIKKFL